MTNEEVVEKTGNTTNEEWIQNKLGIKTRRIAEEDQHPSDLGAEAARRALAEAGMDVSEVDGIVCSVGTGDVLVPATACYIQEKLGTTNCSFAFDIKMACAGSVGGIHVARGMIESGMAKNILVVCTYILSRTTIDWTDRTTAPIFGDGAGAVILTPSPDGESGILQSALHTDGSLTGIVGRYVGGTKQKLTAELLEDGHPKLEMDGPAVWECAMKVLPEVINEVIEASDYEKEDIDFVISHQANKRLVYHVLERAGIPLSKTYTNVEHYGNTSAASAFIALDEAVEKQRFKRGDLVLMMAIGAGMTWGAHLIRW